MSNKRFQGKLIIVTGAGSGIGKAIAIRFAEEGGEVILVGRRRKPLETTAEKITEIRGCAIIYQADISNANQVEGLVSYAIGKWGRIDVLVNNAGIAGDETPILEMTEAQWDLVFDINLKGSLLMSRNVGREMVKTGGGVILHNASIAGLNTDGLYAHYAASKAGLLSLNRSMAVELAPHNIRVNAVSPGYTDTQMNEDVLSSKMVKKLRTAFDRVPIKRMVTTAEIAEVFVFLALDEASGITGANIIVDGGVTANWYILETVAEQEAG
jgi:NAD(P)-dependent dehydrogenase (short-subunit alcohol dehydrogenase family)